MRADRSNYGGIRKLNDIKYIVIHYTANKNDTAENNCKYFQRKNVKSSAHYFIDSDNIIQSVHDNYIAWSIGGKKYSSCSETGGGTFYGRCKNSNSISIELCSDNGSFAPGTINNAVKLVQMLRKKYHISINNVIRHFDVTGKSCPAYWIGTNEIEFLDFKVQVLNPSSITKKSQNWLVKWLQYHINKENSIQQNKIEVDGKYGARTVSAIVEMWKEWGWKPSSGNGVGKKTINRLLQ